MKSQEQILGGQCRSDLRMEFKLPRPIYYRIPGQNKMPAQKYSTTRKRKFAKTLKNIGKKLRPYAAAIGKGAAQGIVDGAYVAATSRGYYMPPPPTFRKGSASTSAASTPRLTGTVRVVDSASRTGQISSMKRTTRVGKKMSYAKKTMALTRANLEKMVYRWNGVKAFSGNGYYFMSHKTIDASTRALPLYLFDLTCCNNFAAGTAVNAIPMLQLQQNIAGPMAFTQVQGLQSDGATLTSNLQIERSTTIGTGAGATAPAPYTKSMLESIVIRMNCWGAVQKATKWYISLVRFTDKDLVPTHGTYAVDLAAANTKRTDLFQSLIKTLTFNPISTTGGVFSKRMKVIKSLAFELEPQQTTDSDSDPSVKTVNWSLKMNKLLDFVENADNLTSIVDTNDQADYVQNTGNQVRAQVKPTARHYLMIRSTNYGLDATESNLLTPSFDLSVKLYHSVAQ